MQALLLIIFFTGYIAIAFERRLNVNKAAIALLMGIISWGIIFMHPFFVEQNDPGPVTVLLSAQLAPIAEVLFFLVGAMTIVQLMDTHDAFSVITDRIRTRNKKKLTWIIGLVTFFLSSVLDNLTTTIVMIALVQKLVSDRNERFLFAGLVIIAANAGGAWTPIGDVTTTMLWIGGQVTGGPLLLHVFLPSFTCMLVPLLLVSARMKGEAVLPAPPAKIKSTTPQERSVIFWSGLGSILSVPLLHIATGLPPYMCILFALSLMWVLTALVHQKKEKEEQELFSVAHALQQIDVPSVLFFLGILLAVAALSASRFLPDFSLVLDAQVGSKQGVALLTGIFSAVIDNVPLVSAAQHMYSYDVNDTFWHFIAYTAGTGGSMLLIGSAAGVTAMGLEDMEFLPYAKKTGWMAALGFLAGAGVYLLQSRF